LDSTLLCAISLSLSLSSLSLTRSQWALGKVEPDAKGDVKHPHGYVIPSGTIVQNGRSNVSCHEHQFITYNEAQSEIKYLLKLKWVKV
jgi:hypothetical protein